MMTHSTRSGGSFLAIFLRSTLLAVVLGLCLSAPGRAQGSGLDYLERADFETARNPQDQATRFLSRAQRSLRQAEKLQAKAGGGDTLAPKAEAEYRRALADLTQAINKNPTVVEAYYLAGTTYLLLGELEKAGGSCYQAWSMDPTLIAAALCETKAALRLEKPRTAQEVYRRVKQKDPSHANQVLAELKTWVESHPDHSSTATLKTWLEKENGAG